MQTTQNQYDCASGGYFCLELPTSPTNRGLNAIMSNACDQLGYTIAIVFVVILITLAALNQFSTWVILPGWFAYLIYFSILYFCVQPSAKPPAGRPNFL
jgi:hypothetical protein